MNFEKLKEKIDSFLDVLKEIKVEIEELSEYDEDIIFMQTKEIENTIEKFKKSNLPIPESLKQLKIDLLDKKQDIEKLRELKQYLLKGINEYIPQNVLNRKNKSHGYRPSKYTGKQIVSAIILGKKYQMKKWNDLLLRVSQSMHENQPDKFENILEIQGKKRIYFSKNQKDISYPTKIPGTDIYMKSYFSVKGFIRISKRILKLFGYNPNELEIEYKDKNNGL